MHKANRKSISRRKSELSDQPGSVRIRRRPPPSENAFAYNLRDAQIMGAPARTKLYELAKEGRLELLKIDGLTLVKGDSLRRLLGAK